MSNLPIAHGSGGHASCHRKREHSSTIEPSPHQRKVAGSNPAARTNADIRPWVSVGEAAQIALSKIVKDRESK